MNLKKWGSLLTAVGMLSSMAAYAPAAVSAEEASYVMTNEYVVAAGEADATITTLFSGVLYNHSTVSYKVEKKTVNSSNTYILTISPKTAGTVYTIPNELIYELAYSRVNTEMTEDDSFDTVSEAASTINEINIVGAAQISKNAFNITKGVDESDVVTSSSLNSVKFNIDCQATYEKTAGKSDFEDIEFVSRTDVLSTTIVGVTKSDAKITHTMQPNTTKKNHQCLYGDKVDGAFEAHSFTKAGGATVGNGAHICKCGKSSEDYKTETGYASNNAHTWDDTKHKCTECGADKFFAHSAEYQKVDSKTHAKKCQTCGDNLSNAEDHNFFITGSDMGRDFAKTCGKTSSGSGKYSDGCGATHTDTEHVYEYAWSYNEDGVAEFNKVGTAKGLVCACGKIKSHSVHNYVKANGHHLCACGNEEKDSSGNLVHNYSQKYNEKGELVAVSTGGVICQDCGYVKSHEHQNGQIVKEDGVVTNTNATFYDETEHKHYCYCGEEISAAQHNAVVDEDNNKHVCEFCKLDLSSDADQGHKYTKVYVAYEYKPNSGDTETAASNAAKVAKRNSSLKTAPVLPSINGFKDSSGGNGTYDDNEETFETAYVCDCGAIKEHSHLYEYGVDQEHYCGCGAKEASPNHDKYYEDATASDLKTYKQCSVCGNIKNHIHTFDYDKDCKCTNSLCNAEDHDYKVVGTKHICQNCGNVGDKELASTHTYEADTVNHKHVCACGAEAKSGTGAVATDPAGTYGHTFVNHVCACGATAHTKATKLVNGKKVHYCNGKIEDGVTDCGYVYTADEDYGHTYNHASDEKCTICQEVNPNHRCVPKTLNPLAASDECRCGAAIEHVWGLDSTNFGTKHQCVNYSYTASTDANGKLVLIKTDNRCTKSDNHVFDTTGTDGKKVDINFCECGAMNPKVLLDAGVIKNEADAGEAPDYKEALTIDSAFASKYKTSYVVELSKAYDAALSYSIKTETNADDIVLAADEKSQATALAAVENFKTVWAKRTENQAASSAEIQFVKEKNEAGLVTVNHSNRGYAVFANGEENTFGNVYGKVGEKVTIQVKPKAGYTFAGWYAKETPSAADKPLSTSAAMEVTITDGHTPYYAMFKENAKQTISFGEGIKYYGSINALKNGTNWSNGTAGFPETLSFLSNEEVVIQADESYFNPNDPATKGITGIKDKYGNIVEYNVSVDPSGNIQETGTKNAYKFNVAYDNSFTVATYSLLDSSDAGCYVQFQIGGKTVASKKFTTRDVTSIQPADPEKVGFEFEGWYFKDDTLKTIQQLKTVTKSCGILVPKFTPIDNLKVTVKNGTIDSSTVKETYTYGDKILVTADLQNSKGKYFSGWFDEDGNLVSKYRTAKINITKSIVLTAQYTRDTELVLEAGVDLSANRTASALELTATRLLTDDMTLVEIGMLYKVGEVAESDMVITNEQLGRKYKSDADKKNGDYVVTLNLSSEAAKKSTISARSYFIYQDAEGVNHTVYSNTVYAKPVQ